MQTIPAVTQTHRATRRIATATVVGGVLRVGWWSVAHPAPVSDFLGYRSIAFRLFSTGEFTRLGVATAYRTPGYPAFLALGMVASRSNQWLSLMNVALSVAAIPLTAWFALRVGLGERIAVGAAVLVAVIPSFVLFAPVLASEHLQLVLMLIAWSLSCATTTRPRAIAAGLVYGAAVLVRPESLFFLLAVPWLIRIAVAEWRRIVALAGLTVVGAGLVVLPWCVRNEVVVGRGAGLSTTGGFNFYLAHRPDQGYRFIGQDRTPLAGLGEVEANRRGEDLGRRAIEADPLGLVRTTWHHSYELFRTPTYVVYYGTRRKSGAGATVPRGVFTVAGRLVKAGWFATVALLPFGAVGLFMFRRLRSARNALLALVVANWFCFTVVFWGMPRYRYVVDPVLVVVATVGLNALVDLGRAAIDADDRVVLRRSSP